MPPVLVEPERLVMVCTSDIAGQFRGKGFPARDLEKRRRHGIGWTPTNVMINCFNRIPATPWGPRGDLVILPDPAGEVALDWGDGSGIEHFFIGDVKTLDGAPWSCCPRSFLRAALEALEQRAGLRLYAAFEHEFHAAGASQRCGDSYGLSSLRGVARFVEELIGGLRAAGLEPETVLPEYGPRQYEVTVEPAFGLEAADRAVKLREITRALGRRHGLDISFAPVVTPGIVGNGVHVHFSLTDRQGHPITWDPAGPGGLSPRAAAFAAGILRHIRALCAVTAPSILSYERLKPRSWSAYYGNLGDKDREAALRICPVPQLPGTDPAPLFNLEFRAADAAASPYLLLGMLVHAGLAGIEADLPAPPIVGEALETMGEEERARLGIQDLPRSLGEALDALQDDAAAAGWMGPELHRAYLMHKRGEIEMASGWDMETLVRRYAEAY